MDEFECGADLGFGEGGASATEVAAGGAVFGDGVGDAFAFNLQFHLRECGHDGEDHGTHGRFRVYISTAEIQHPQSDISADYDQAGCFGAVALVQTQICRGETNTELLVSSGGEDETPWGGVPPECKTLDRRDVVGGARALVVCDYSAGKDTHNVWVVGDSHGQQWRQSLLPYAKDHQWKLTFFTHSSCPIWDVPMTFRGVGDSTSPTPEVNQQECTSWAQETAQTIREAHPDLVFVGNYSTTEGIDDGSGANQPEQYRRAIESGAKSWGLGLEQLVVFRDTPTAGNVLGPACVSVSGANCVTSPDVVLYDDPQAQAAQALDVPVIDMSGFFCPGGSCKGVIGRVPVYYDTNHISRSYMQSLAGPVRDELNRLLQK